VRLSRYGVLGEPGLDQSLLVGPELFQTHSAQNAQSLVAVDHPIPSAGAKPLAVAAPRPLCRMRHHPGSDHVQIDVDHSVPEMWAFLIVVQS
jgi:hypothetical protein